MNWIQNYNLVNETDESNEELLKVVAVCSSAEYAKMIVMLPNMARIIEMMQNYLEDRGISGDETAEDIHRAIREMADVLKSLR